MIEFKILKRSKKSNARLGILKTPHGEIETPAFVPVATQATIKALTIPEVEKTNTQLLICNTFHLHLKPGEEIVKKQGGLHKFSNWKKPLMTDSGGFQVFSLGFGRDMDVGKVGVNKFFPGKELKKVDLGEKSTNVLITNRGAWFRSPLNGQKLFLGPKESIEIQQSLGADIIFSFDECTPPAVTREYMRKSLDRTHKWAKECLEYKKSDQAIYGIVQGSVYKDFRQEAAKYINSLGFNGFGIGGDLGKTTKEMFKIISWITPCLDEKKPRHLLGIGSFKDIKNIARSGMDTFDCNMPTLYGRHGIAFTSTGQKIDLKKGKFLRDKNPIDKNCQCFVCQNHSRGYITHLFKAKEISALSLLSFHNLYAYNKHIENIREEIKRGNI